jgi:hypothetical protein
MAEIRKFSTGATRDSEHGKLDFEGFLSPQALEAFAEYMDGHRVQQDGEIRPSDNWQQGIPLDAYMKSAWRHFFAWWKIHRGGEVKDERDGHNVSAIEAVCGVLFNAMGYIHEIKNSQPPFTGYVDGEEVLIDSSFLDLETK